MGDAMDSLDIWTRVVVIAVGLIFGGFAVFSPSWVWFRHQKLTILAVLLGGLGTALLCSSIFGTITVSAGPSGLQLKLDKIEAQLQTLQTALIETNDAIKSAQASLKWLPAGGIASAQDVRAVSAKLDGLEQASQMKFIELQKDTLGVARKIDSVSATIDVLKAIQSNRDDRSSTGNRDVAPAPFVPTPPLLPQRAQ